MTINSFNEGRESDIKKSRTFGELREAILDKLGVDNHFKLFGNYGDLWEDINRTEYQMGYNPKEYLRPKSIALCDMKLLSQQEFDDWLQRLERL